MWVYYVHVIILNVLIFPQLHSCIEGFFFFFFLRIVGSECDGGGTLSACNTVLGYIPHPVKMAGLGFQPELALIMPSTTLLRVKPTTGIIFGINLNFSQPCKGKMFTGVSQRT